MTLAQVQVEDRQSGLEFSMISIQGKHEVSLFDQTEGFNIFQL